MKKDFHLLLRGIFIGLFGSLHLLALSISPLSITMSIISTFPLFLVLFSKFLLKEEVKAYQWGTVIAGFIGICLIIRPSGSVSFAGAALSFCAMLSQCLFQVETKRLAGKYSSEELMFPCMAMAVAINLLLATALGTNILTSLPWGSGKYFLLLLPFGVLAYVGNLIVIRAFFHAKASVLAPFNYLQLMANILMGVLFFHEQLDFLTWIGIAIIMASGITQALLSCKRKT